jgi:N-acetylmuramoyl-L-alanine amidase
MAFINYAVQSAIIMGIFCAVYHLLFRRLTFFTINRYFLIGSLLLSLSIPLIKVEVERPLIHDTVEDIKGEYGVTIYNDMLDVVESREVGFNQGLSGGRNIFDLKTAMVMLYLMVCSLLLIRLLFAVFRLLGKAKKGERLEGFIWIQPFSKFNNCSFFNLLIIDKDRLSEFELQQVLTHEKEHKNRLHSLDQVFLELLFVLFWFNPFIYYYKKAINAVHEYEVDQKLSACIDRQSYGNLLLKLAAPTSTYLTHGFSQNSLKRRIQFIFGKSSNRFKKLTYAVAVPLIVLMISIFSFQKANAIAAMIYLPAVINENKETSKQALQTSATREIEEPSIARNILENAYSLKIVDVIKPVLSGTLDVDQIIEDNLEYSYPGKMTIVLDPGHGGEDNASSFNGVSEKDLVLQIALKIRATLEGEGFNVSLTRDADNTVKLRDRVQVAGDVFVSIHANTAPKDYETKLKGMEIVVPNKFRLKDSILLNKSLSLASHLRSGLSSLDISMRKEFKEQSLFVLGNNTKPAVLLEVGYLSNHKDFNLLTDESYQTRLAQNFASALMKYRTAIQYSNSSNKLLNLNGMRLYAEDSIVLNNDKSVLSLYGKATAETGSVKISADKIFLNLKTGGIAR